MEKIQKPYQNDGLGLRKCRLLCVLFSFMLLMHAMPAAPQSLRVTGTVTDESGESLPGASITVAGEKGGVMTDIDGHYTIEAAVGKTLSASYVGYKPKTVKIGKGMTSIDFVLTPDDNVLDEVVAVGYATDKKVNLTGAVTAVSTKEFTRRPITQLSTALQGIAPGVTVTTAGGAPGSDGANIQIRGIGSFGGSDCSPLVLIDGVEGDLNSVDASQIDQISVLKDAASSSIYGSRAANGVILITTKRAEKGAFSVTYRGYVG